MCCICLTFPEHFGQFIVCDYVSGQSLLSYSAVLALVLH